ncbi:hypothetical protein [Ferrimonas lipolytica]|uniref:Uncharacterized protein n=1 Tax=Ferrimonas lipolytica TaxID=2724191 RepID=A0A6H1UGG2_9GAMM|nr:hypothetical protein HER31_15225 [Ferrimonas lipolytica]
MAYYKHIHDDKIKFKTSEEAVSFGLDAAGISKADYNAKKDSSEVRKLLAKWDRGVAIAKIKGCVLISCCIPSNNFFKALPLVELVPIPV